MTSDVQDLRTGTWIGSVGSVSWGAIFAGAVAALATWMLLYALGLALGLSVVDRTEPDSVRSSGIFTGIWGVVAPLIALFIGGAVASRGARVLSRADGAIYGLEVWALTVLAGAWLAASVLGTLMGGAVELGKTAVEAGTAAVTGAASGAAGAGEAFGLDAQGALAPVNARLRAEGKPEITPDQLNAAVGDIVRRAASEGRLDREMLINTVAERTALSRPDAEEIAMRIQGQIDAARQQASQAMTRATEKVQSGALRAAEKADAAAWVMFAALALGLAASIAGAMLGVGRRRRDWVEHAGEDTLEYHHPREVHP
jgi:hypothetical protein